MMWNRAFRVVAVGALVGILMGCADADVAPSGTVASEAAVQTDVPTVEITEAATQAATVEAVSTEVVPTVEAGVPLSEDGPWLVFTADDENLESALWAINEDGTGLTRLSGEPIRDFQVRPGGTIQHMEIAYIEKNQLGPYNVKMLVLPEGRVTTVASLTSDEIGATWTQENADIFYALSASYPKWSPDGKLLAFVGAMQGSTADVYTYSPQSGEIKQISSGAGQASGIQWSPDGRWILHTTTHASAGAGSENGFWAASVDGDTVTTLFEPADVGEMEADYYRVYHWIDNNTIFDGSIRQFDGKSEIVAINVSTGEHSDVRRGGFTQATYDSKRNSWYFIPWLEGRQLSETIICLKDGMETEIPLPDGVSQISWSSAADMLFILPSPSIVYGLNADQSLLRINSPDAVAPVFPRISPEHDWWVWYYGWRQDPLEGLWINPPFEEPRMIAKDLVQTVIWSEDGQTLIFSNRKLHYGGDGGGLWVATAPNFEPRFIAPLRLNQGVWIP